MNVPKWLIGVWVAQVILNSAIYFWSVAFLGLSRLLKTPYPVLTSATYWIAVCITVAWFLWSATGVQRSLAVLWIAALFVATFLNNLRPAAPGGSNYLPYIGPPVTLAVAAAIMLAVWKFHKPRAA